MQSEDITRRRRRPGAPATGRANQGGCKRDLRDCGGVCVESFCPLGAALCGIILSSEHSAAADSAEVRLGRRQLRLQPADA
eukprot:6646981-Prymnesium_polylepis.1